MSLIRRPRQTRFLPKQVRFRDQREEGRRGDLLVLEDPFFGVELVGCGFVHPVLSECLLEDGLVGDSFYLCAMGG